MMLEVIHVDTDVLVIGGGLGGCMAAIHAANQGARVAVTDKSNIIASGAAATGVDHVWSYIPPIHEKMGYSIEEMTEDHRLGMSAGFLRKDLFRLVAGTMYERVLDLERFGIRFRYEDGKAPGNFRIVPQFHSVPTSFNFDGAPLKRVLTREVKKRGAEVFNRVQMLDLLVHDGQAAGAVGVGTRSGDIYVFRAKAVVLATGRANRIGRNLTGYDFNTRIPAPFSGDGQSMAIRAGLPLINMEFLSGRILAPCANYNPNYGDPRNTTQPAARIIDGQGNVLVPRTFFYDWENLGKEKWSLKMRKDYLEERRVIGEARRFMVEQHRSGGGPFYLDFSEATDEEKAYIEWSIGHEGKGTQFLRYFLGEEKADLRKNMQEYAGYSVRELSGYSAVGLWVDENLETELKNLFAIGDVAGGIPFGASPAAFTMGWHAGGTAAKRAKEEGELLSFDEGVVDARKRLCEEILGRKRGFYWREVETYVQNVMDFYCGDVRSDAMLRRGLERLEDAKGAPLKAENPHELARSLDVKSIIDVAEVVLRASMERKETRLAPTPFRRAEYPQKDDAQWLCFLAIQKQGNDFVFTRFPVEPK
ncbi:MAG: FAD-dependent oxidoreductase [Desulfobacteraceae bacterium]|nr:MAG: FAD-dependent oxidoreductase [Desulfobacteraceae bacterium]